MRANDVGGNALDLVDTTGEELVPSLVDYWRFLDGLAGAAGKVRGVSDAQGGLLARVFAVRGWEKVPQMWDKRGFGGVGAMRALWPCRPPGSAAAALPLAGPARPGGPRKSQRA
jgi:hypothetical protein